MPQTESSSQQPDLEQFKAALRESQLPDDAKMAVVRSFAKSIQSGDTKDAFANSINDLPGVPNDFKVKLLTLRFPQLKPQGVAHPPPGAPEPKPDNSPSFWDTPLIPLDKAIAGPEKGQPAYEQFGRGVLQGGAAGGANLSTPKNIGIMGGAALAQMIPGVDVALDAAGLAIGGEEAWRIIKTVPEAFKAANAGDWGKVGHIVGDDVASAAAGGYAAKGGVSKLKGKFGEGPIPDTTPAGNNRTPPPPPGAPPTYPLIEAGTPKAQAQPQGAYPMPGTIQGGLPAGQAPPSALPGGQQPLQLPPASQIQLPGTPTPIPMGGAPQRPSGLLIEQGGHQSTPPPPGANLARPSANPQPAEAGTGTAPVSRQITDGSGPMTYDVYLERAKTLPKEELAKHVQQMIGAMTERAETLPKSKRAEFIKAAKAYIEPFEKILDGGDEPKGPEAPPAKKDTPPPKKKTEAKAPPPKKETANPEPESNVGQDAGTADPEMSSRVKNQLDSAKAKGIKKLKFTVERGPGMKPLEIGVNADIDTPGTIAAKIAKAGGGGKVQAESTDPEHPLKWSFYVGGGAAPPGAK